MMGRPGRRPKQLVRRGRSYRVGHERPDGFDDTEARSPCPETVLRIDMIDKKIVAKRSDRCVGRQRQERSGGNDRLYFFPLLAPGIEATRFYRSPVRIPETRSDR